MRVGVGGDVGDEGGVEEASVGGYSSSGMAVGSSRITVLWLLGVSGWAMETALMPSLSSERETSCE